MTTNFPNGLPRNKNFLFLVRTTPEGRLLLAFFGVAFILIAMLVYNIIYDPVTAAVMSEIVTVNSMGGRGPAVGLCFYAGWAAWQAYLYNVLLETANLFLIYSLFTLSVHHYLEFQWLTRLRNNAEKTAHRFEHWISRYGFWGVMVFVAIPLPFTGPVIGSIIAYFLKFSVKKTLLATIPGFMLSIGVWVLFFNKLQENRTAFMTVFIALIVITLFGLVKILYTMLSGKKENR